MNPRPIPFSREQLEAIAAEHPTPFHLYDEEGIRGVVRSLLGAFDWAPRFKEYFAVKATPNPYIMELLREEGCGTDCSSMAEMNLSEAAGVSGEDIMFTSNNTPAAEFHRAAELGAVINLDDITHIEYLAEHVGLPELLSFRYNPGPSRSGNVIIGAPEEAKYGLTREQLFEGYRTIRDRGVQRFGLHTMVVSNELDHSAFTETAHMLFELALELHAELGIRFDFINLGGGIGIPYRPDQQPVDMDAVGTGIRRLYDDMIAPTALHPLTIAMENGRMITGPHGYLVTRVRHTKDIYRQYLGVDACMANLMRPGMYDAYHHISVPGKDDQPLDHVYDVVGSLCENNDKFAVNRSLPEVQIGDLLVIQDAGAHGHAMGFNYNGKLRSSELLINAEGGVRQIRRAETEADYFATLDHPGLNN